MDKPPSDIPLGFRICNLVQGLIAVWSARDADDLLQNLAWPLNGHTDGWGDLLDSLVLIDAEHDLPEVERSVVREAISLLQEGFRRRHC